MTSVSIITVSDEGDFQLVDCDSAGNTVATHELTFDGSLLFVDFKQSPKESKFKYIKGYLKSRSADKVVIECPFDARVYDFKKFVPEDPTKVPEYKQFIEEFTLKIGIGKVVNNELELTNMESSFVDLCESLSEFMYTSLAKSDLSRTVASFNPMKKKSQKKSLDNAAPEERDALYEEYVVENMESLCNSRFMFRGSLPDNPEKVLPYYLFPKVKKYCAGYTTLKGEVKTKDSWMGRFYSDMPVEVDGEVSLAESRAAKGPRRLNGDDLADKELDLSILHMCIGQLYVNASSGLNSIRAEVSEAHVSAIREKESKEGGFFSQKRKTVRRNN